MIGIMTVLTDALPAVWHRDANMGIFSAVRHQVIRLLMATRSSCLFACPCFTDKQGNYSRLAIITAFVVIVDIIIIIVGYLQELQVCVMIVLQVLVFYFVRCVLAFSCCVCELYFYKWVHTLSSLPDPFGSYSYLYVYVYMIWFLFVTQGSL